MIIKLPLLALLFLPAFALAHTRWFAEAGLSPLATDEPTTLYLGVAVVSVVVLVLIGIWLHQNDWLRLKSFRPKNDQAFARAASTFTLITGTFLLIAGTHGYLFSPNLTLESGIPTYLVVIQILIGLLFLVGIFNRLAAILLGVIWIIAYFDVGLVATIENIWVLSTAMFIAVMGNEYFSIFSFSVLRKYLYKYKNHALSFLRIGTGTTLLVLGFSEKILAPEFGINFLSQHQWNFMQHLGFNYSDYLFTISAGSVEILLGTVFILGIVTRLNALVTAIIFSTPLFILGPVELAGHLPHFAAVVLLLLFGGGGHFSLFRTYRDEKVS